MNMHMHVIQGVAALAAALALALHVGAVPAALAGPPGSAAPAVEYYHAGLDHYFTSPLAADIEALDSQRLAGWVRTGQTFAAELVAAAGLSPVCRFYIPPAHGDSHFLSASPDECADVLARIGVDPNFSGYVQETPAAFHIALPDIGSGACPAGYAPVYRLWNGRADSNHRLTADPRTKAAMVAQGYVAEGYGPDQVAMCAQGARNVAALAAVSGASPFAAGCERVFTVGQNFAGSEVEPMVAVNPHDPQHLVAIWQQDRWSNGGARGVLMAVSRDGGATWTPSAAPLSRCTGGSAGNGGDYPRISNPWVAFGRDGTVYATSLSFGGAIFTPSSFNAILVTRSLDGGLTWSNPATLIRDTNTTFNDKDAVTADPTDARYAYVVWDRLAANGWGPAYFARTTDGGATWEAARPIYDPGNADQTINNQIVVAADGTLVNFFTRINNRGNDYDTFVAIVRSPDRGVSWTPPTVIAQVFGVGTQDPDTGLPIRDGTFCGAIAAGPDGSLVAVWQDARFSGGERDGIAMSRSPDGGATWSAPVQVNRRPEAQALLPAVAIRADGTIGIAYYDLRSNTPDPATLLADNWLVESSDGGATWRETHLAGPFDLALAPVTDTGYFLGDYQALIAVEDRFVATHVTTTRATLPATSDVVASYARTFGTPSPAASYADAGAGLPQAGMPREQGSGAASTARRNDAPVAAVAGRAPAPGSPFAARIQENARRALAARIGGTVR